MADELMGEPIEPECGALREFFNMCSTPEIAPIDTMHSSIDRGNPGAEAVQKAAAEGGYGQILKGVEDTMQIKTAALKNIMKNM